MRRFVGLLVAATLAVGVASTAGPASAVGAAKSNGFCPTVKRLQDEVDALPANTNGVDRKAARATARALRKAADSTVAPSKIKRALRTIAAVYQRLANGDSLIDVIAEDGIAFGKAALMVGAYYQKHC